MNRISVIVALVATLAFPAICAAQGGRPVSIENQGSWNVDDPILMVNTPEGHGTPFPGCYMNDTYDPANGNISVYLEYDDQWPGPVTHVNQDSWRLEFEGVDDLESCLPLTFDDDDQRYELWIWGPFDSSNSSTGIYTISRTLAAGGHGSCTVKLVYDAVTGNEHEFGTLHFISPDITGDGVVNISDTPVFASAYYSGIYHKEIDFEYDGTVGLSDLAYYVGAYLEACP